MDHFRGALQERLALCAGEEHDRLREPRQAGRIEDVILIRELTRDRVCSCNAG